MSNEATELAPRAFAVLSRVNQLKSGINENVLELGELLVEIRDNHYHQVWGFDTLALWLGSSGLDVGERQAYYLMKVIDSAKKLGIGRDEMAKVKVSKLKKIFTLNPDKHPERIKQLVAAGEGVSLDEIIKEVAKTRADDDGWEAKTWRNFSLLTSQAAIVDEAVERAKMESGSVTNAVTGEVMDISNATALERICADYLASPNELEMQYAEVRIEDGTS